MGNYTISVNFTLTGGFSYWITRVYEPSMSKRVLGKNYEITVAIALDVGAWRETST